MTVKFRGATRIARGTTKAPPPPEEVGKALESPQRLWGLNP
jgi:hypothetical protein